MLTIVHISDLHFGPYYYAPAGEAATRLILAVKPDVVVASGDFTQRARRRQFQEAAEFLGQFAAIPTVVVPGNHDIPLYRVWERMLSPYGHYRRALRHEGHWSFRHERAIVVALNSTCPWMRIVEGRVRRAHLEFCRRTFATAPAELARIVTLHHPLVSPGGDCDYVPPRGARELLDGLADLGVRLVLAGHLHRQFVATHTAVGAATGPSRSVQLVHSGTTSSLRGRGPERRRQSLNVIRVENSDIVVTPHWYEEAAGEFIPQVKSPADSR